MLAGYNNQIQTLLSITIFSFDSDIKHIIFLKFFVIYTLKLCSLNNNKMIEKSKSITIIIFSVTKI